MLGFFSWGVRCIVCELSEGKERWLCLHVDTHQMPMFFFELVCASFFWLRLKFVVKQPRPEQCRRNGCDSACRGASKQPHPSKAQVSPSFSQHDHMPFFLTLFRLQPCCQPAPGTHTRAHTHTHTHTHTHAHTRTHTHTHAHTHTHTSQFLRLSLCSSTFVFLF